MRLGTDEERTARITEAPQLNGRMAAPMSNRRCGEVSTKGHLQSPRGAVEGCEGEQALLHGQGTMTAGEPAQAWPRGLPTTGKPGSPV